MNRKLFISAFFLFTGCTVYRSAEIDHKDTNQAPTPPPPSVSDSFKVEKTPETPSTPLSASKAEISIRKDAFKKEFLIQSELIRQPLAPSFHSLRSRIIYFDQCDDKHVCMYESPKGHVATGNLTPNLLLAQFPITKAAEDFLTIDFNKGMSRLFLISEHYDRGDKSPTVDTTMHEARARVSYVADASLSSDKLRIRQFAQIEVASGSGFNALPIEIRYYLSGYSPSPGFAPTKSKSFDRFGFFEIAPQITKDGDTVVYAEKFDLKKPIIFVISGNTPDAFREPIRDAARYWNNAFHAKIMKIADDTSNAIAPDIDHNIIQWVDWDQADGAYADMQVDPLTGEVLHAQIYLTSNFAGATKLTARQMLSALNAEANNSTPNIGLKGFEFERTCQFRADPSRDGLSKILAQGFDIDEKKLMQIAQDEVRSAATHEIGHTLGLRHNFAGSLGANIPLAQSEEVFKQYVSTGAIPDAVLPASSVMEYPRFDEDLLSGSYIHKGLALKHDEVAIQALYFQKTYSNEEFPLYCPDELAGDFQDCLPFDAGNDPAEVAASAAETIARLPYDLLYSYVAAKAPPYGADPVPIAKLSLDPEKRSQDLMEPRITFVKSLTNEGRLLRIERQFEFVDASNKEEITRRKLDYLAAESQKYGGPGKILASIPVDFADREYTRFEAVLNSGTLSKGIGPNGKAYEFTPDEIATIRTNVRAFYKRLQLELVKNDIAVLNFGQSPDSPNGDEKVWGKSPQLEDHPFSDALAGVYAQKMRDYLLASVEKIPVQVSVTIAASSENADDEQQKDDNGDGGENAPKKPDCKDNCKATQNSDGSTTYVYDFQLPKFLYPFEVRAAAAALLSADHAKYMGWGFVERTAVLKEFAKFLSDSVNGIPLSMIDPNKVPPIFARWALENQQFLTQTKDSGDLNKKDNTDVKKSAADATSSDGDSEAKLFKFFSRMTSRRHK